jgi:hypothetical protein
MRVESLFATVEICNAFFVEIERQCDRVSSILRGESNTSSIVFIRVATTVISPSVASVLASLCSELDLISGGLAITHCARRNGMRTNLGILNFAKGISLLIGLIMIASLPGFGQRGSTETIDATAFGTSTQLGRNFGVKILIYEFSSPEDRDILVQAFQQGQNDGMVNALEKMKSVGRITIPGTLGFDLSFIREIITPTGRTIRFVTNRKIAFGESYWSTQTKSFNLTAGEINIDDNDKSKSGGVLFPAAQLIVNKEGELQWELNQNSWKLTNIIEWK